jgi:hypothetical protein
MIAHLEFYGLRKYFFSYIKKQKNPNAALPMQCSNVFFFCVFQYYFTVNFTHENQKALELRTEDVKDGDEWVAAITHAR